MQVALQKWGNSLALRIPAGFARQIKVRQGDPVQLSLADNKLTIQSAKPSFQAKSLIRKIRKGQLHRETDWGASRGNEVW
ncbi:MAG: AbrB/MazE/SpoVT family DNA-binding domain-containing protein [Verrucomicrobia bacterium]|jgi:antitoxin MazE|nr:AbrB/MazE/SpoVT family DNA-binding domain-containing protein [Verrucomicrobiota bacterium]NDC01022.1 AbrB/MazE/SpoVT family DNA-binding domain-containing protein [Verrucomicrobiota bacterium]NDF17127.1 AbrB/MazE/SpoVT family DNA-binding domain-containing protein [Verrucomicrobiota bacterium]